jgi:hypothetical protein
MANGITVYLASVTLEKEQKLGTFPFVQLTYNSLRVGPDGDFIGHLDHRTDVWSVEGCDFPVSDITIASEDYGE